MMMGFVHCKDSGCEDDWFLGDSGICNFTTALCECAPEFHGKDDYTFYNNCHINKDMQSGIYIACIVVATILLLHAVGGLVFLSFRWGYIGFENQNQPKKRRGENRERTLSSSFSGFGNSKYGDSITPESLNVNVGTEFSMNRNSQPRPDSAANSIAKSKFFLAQTIQHGRDRVWKVQRRRARYGKLVKRRQQDTLIALFLFGLFALGLLVYYVPMLLGNYRSSNSGIATDLGAAVAVSSIFSGLWLVSYMWYKSLPSVALYGRLFHIDSVLLRWPRFVKIVTIIQVILVDVLSFSFLLVIPQARPEWREICNEIILQCFIVFLLMFTSYFFFLCCIIKKIFIQLDRLNQQTENIGGAVSVDHDAFKRGISISTLMIRMDLAIGIVAVGAAVCAAYIPFFRKRLFISISVVSLSASLVANILVYIFVKRLQTRHKSVRVGEEDQMCAIENNPTSFRGESVTSASSL